MTGFTSSTFYIEAEPPRLIASHLGLRGLAEQFTYIAENPYIGSRIGSWRTSNGLLININYFINILSSAYFPAFPGSKRRLIQLIGQAFEKNIIYQCTLA